MEHLAGQQCSNMYVCCVPFEFLENLTRRNDKSELVLEFSIVFFSVSEIDF